MTLHARPVPNDQRVHRLRQGHVRAASAPLDGMWLCGLVPAARHVGLFQGDELVGYYCIDDDEQLLQFYVDDRCRVFAAEAFDAALERDQPQGAVVSTAEAEYLSFCFDRFDAFEVNALMYQHQYAAKSEQVPLVSLGDEQLDEAVVFAHATLGAPKAWLRGYYAGLISRGELYALRESATLVGLGESRGFQGLQPGYADLGVIIGREHRGRSLATRVLCSLVSLNEQRGLKSMCSTESSNLAARKAIGRAGFTACNRIIRFSSRSAP